MDNMPVSSHFRVHEATVTSLSITMVAVIAVAIVMLFRNTEVDYSPRIPSGVNTLEGALVTRAPMPVVVEISSKTQTEPVQDKRLAEITLRFQQAVMMLHAQQYEHAATALHRVLELSPRLTDAYVNMGYALLGLERFREAESFFRAAIDLEPYQGNAYWGLATALENQHDLQGALGAMRTFIHLTPADNPFVRRARSALWEWDTQLARGPLPEAEAQWLKEEGQKWQDRNSPRLDMADTPGQGTGTPGQGTGDEDLSIAVQPLSR